MTDITETATTTITKTLESNMQPTDDQQQEQTSQSKCYQPQSQLQLLNCDLLGMEHLHLNKLSLQRSGYLWKTGPNFKSFKYRWCILYRHNLDLTDANFSYYFNRFSISASLSGKIMMSDIEFISVCESVPQKTKIPKLESKKELENLSDDINGLGIVCFLEIGVRSRQGRIFLFAARTHIDRQLWMHAFVQALCLHAFKNKGLIGYLLLSFLYFFQIIINLILNFDLL